MSLDPVTTGEAGRILGVSAERVRQLEAAGQLVVTARTSSGMRIFNRVEVEVLAAKRAAAMVARARVVA